MNKTIISIILSIFALTYSSYGACSPTFDALTSREVIYSGSCTLYSESYLSVLETYSIRWSDNVNTSTGTSDFRGAGKCKAYMFSSLVCEPDFIDKRYEDFGSYGRYSKEVISKAIVRDACSDDYRLRKFVTHTCSRPPGGGGCGSGFTVSGEKFKTEEDSVDACSPCNPDPDEINICQQNGGTYDWSSCQCGQSPIVIDVLGNGFNLTNAANGVNFDINGDGTSDRLAWSSVNSDDAWLVLDRNENGTIDSGKELFGNSTSQPAPPTGEMKNGFLALAVFDKFQNGGNEDGILSGQDLVFANLRLWQDINHNGISETTELKTLAELGLAKINLDYQDSRRTDEHGNRFKYKAKVRDVQGAQIGRWAWDVYLVVQLQNN